MKGDTWKLEFDVKELMNGSKVEEDGDDPIYTEAKLRVEILKKRDEDMYCVDFKKMGGNYQLSYDTVHKYFELLEL